MKKWLPVLSLLLFSVQQLQAQNKRVLLEPQNRRINQGEPLPPQSTFDIQVPVTSHTGIIRINVFKGNDSKNVLQRTYWARPVNFTGDFAELPVDLRLRNNSKYGFEVTIYSLLSDSERVALKQIVHQNITNYLRAMVEANSKGINVEKNSQKVVDDLNGVFRRSLMYYRNTQQREFEGFSDIVKLKLQQVDRARLSNARFNIAPTAADSSKSPDELKAMYASQLTSELEGIILNEADNYLNLDIVKLYDSFVIANRITERSQTVLPLFVGYGGIYLSGKLSNIEYDSSPYAGLSFPLGNGSETHYGRTSFILGVFLQNFRNGAGAKLTGPIVGRPVFTGLGFRIYDFINLNAGVVAISTEKNTISNIKTEDVQLKPFIGLNAQFNLWLGLNKK